MAQLTIEVEDGLLADMTALARAERRGPVEVVNSAITEYVREHGATRPSKSVKVGGTGKSISVTESQHPPAPCARLLVGCVFEQFMY